MSDGNFGEDVACKCVFCGWKKAKLYPQRVGQYRRTGENWQMVCNKCRARGPLKPTPAEARSSWHIIA